MSKRVLAIVSSTSQFQRLVGKMQAEIVFLRDETKNKNKIISNYWEILTNHKSLLQRK